MLLKLGKVVHLNLQIIVRKNLAVEIVLINKNFRFI